MTTGSYAAADYGACANAGGGGGMSAVYLGAGGLTYISSSARGSPGTTSTAAAVDAVSSSMAKLILVAGGGGGAGNSYSGGMGGGETGGAGTPFTEYECGTGTAGDNGGGGGSQTQGGSFLTTSGHNYFGNRHYGQPLLGGQGSANIWSGSGGWPNGGISRGYSGTNGGGGGGGWFGGGGGGSNGDSGNSGGGGGGSSFPQANLANANTFSFGQPILTLSHSQGTSGDAPPAISDSDYTTGTARGASDSYQSSSDSTACAGGNGQVVITMSNNVKQVFSYTGSEQTVTIT